MTKNTTRHAKKTDGITQTALTVILPTYNESRRITQTLDTICTYLQGYFHDSRLGASGAHGTQNAQFEILIVDDGSTDGTIAKIKSFQEKEEERGKEQEKQKTKERNEKGKNKNRETKTGKSAIGSNSQTISHPLSCRIIELPHLGKGAAVREGMRQAKGEYVFFTDCDLATPLDAMQQLIARIDEGCDVAIASRNLPTSSRVIEQSSFRHALGQLFPKVVNTLFSLNISDTQCGFKMYTNRAAKIISSEQTINGWAFDVEQLVIAQEQDLKVCEVPVRWTDKSGSRINALRDGLSMLRELMIIWINRYHGRYRAKQSDSNSKSPGRTLRRPRMEEFLLFVFTGGISTIVDWGLFALLLAVAVPSISKTVALVIAYCAGACVNYITNRKLTFNSTDKRIVRQTAIFSIIVACNLVLSILLFDLLDASFIKSALIARMVTTVIILFVNYIMHKNITFAKEKRFEE